MIMSSSLVILKVNNINNLDSILKDTAFEDNESFIALSFDSTEKNTGELHWSNSFKFGKMNMIYFIREEEYFYLFTSAVDNKKILRKALDDISGGETELETLKPPLFSKISSEFSIPEIERYDINKHFGISAWLRLSNWHGLVKIYTNGLITYKMTNNKDVLKEIINISKILINQCRQEIE
ncbi:hypothetical protein P5663_02990 [Priestia flexa]|uniref:hypothetical protein n=1 Tax=Priestia flexa TaxID=86664 RepID=UPI00240DB63B|nr:hypothetical protein [Priestia flexa]WEZ08873.1 hypothetical protein P5663_02990 [Priestia flexa]